MLTTVSSAIRLASIAPGRPAWERRRAGQAEWLERLQAEAGNLVAAVRWYLDHDRLQLPTLFRALWLFWAWGDFRNQARSWLEQLLPDADALDLQGRIELTFAAAAIAVATGDDTTALAACEQLGPLMARIQDPYMHAVSQLTMAWSRPIVGDLYGGLRQVVVALEELHGQDAPFATFIAAFTAGSIETALGRYDHVARHLALARDMAEECGSVWTVAGSRVHLGILYVLQGRLEEARSLLAEALDLSLKTRSPSFVTLCVAGYARLAFAEGNLERAALLEGAAEGLRRRVGISAWAFVRPVEASLVARVRERLGAHRFDQAFRVGSGLTQREAVAAVRDQHGTGAQTSLTVPELSASNPGPRMGGIVPAPARAPVS